MGFDLIKSNPMQQGYCAIRYVSGSKSESPKFREASNYCDNSTSEQKLEP